MPPASNNLLHVHFVIPAWREANRLPATLRELLPALAPAPVPVTLQVVDDGSPSADRAALEAGLAPLLAAFPSSLLPLLPLPQHRGKGAAILAGWGAAPSAATHLGFLDADGSVPPAEVIRLLTCLAARPDTVLFASRIRMLGRSITRSAFRHYAGRVFATCVGLLIDPRVYDSQCGCKLLPASAFRRIRPRLRESGFLFDVELLAWLLRAGCPVHEIPIDWHDSPGGHVSLLRHAPAMLLALLRLRRRLKRLPAP